MRQLVESHSLSKIIAKVLVILMIKPQEEFRNNFDRLNQYIEIQLQFIEEYKELIIKNYKNITNDSFFNHLIVETM